LVSTDFFDEVNNTAGMYYVASGNEDPWVKVMAFTSILARIFSNSIEMSNGILILFLGHGQSEVVIAFLGGIWLFLGVRVFIYCGQRLTYGGRE
jgi:hypothetical protein